MKLIHGDCLEVLRTMPENSVDSIVTDPPYGWRFMGKAWDGADIKKRIKAPSKTEWHENRKIGHKRSGLDTGSQHAGLYDLSPTGNQAFQHFSEEWAREAYRVPLKKNSLKKGEPMSYEIQALDTAIPSVQLQTPAPLPSKEFIGYDPHGTTTITGSDRSLNVKQTENSEGNAAQASSSTEESITLSPKVSAIARREQAQRQREQSLKQREKDLADKLQKAEQFEKLQAKIAAKDYSAAEDLGLQYDDYTNHLVTKQAEKNPEAEKLTKVERELEALKKAQEESTIREYQANQTLWKQEISRVVASGDEYSAIKELGAENLVLQHINDSFEEDGLELTAEEAAKEIESALVERAEKLAGLSKIKQRFEQPAKRLGAPKTITQNMTVTSQKTVRKPFHLMSESEQIAEAYRRVQEAKMQR